MAGLSLQRAHHQEALELSRQASEALQPLHDDLAEISPTFDGIVYFAKDHWHKNNASAVATVQPESADAERFAFYKNNIAYRRVDLGATALGDGLRLQNPAFIRSRMNPEHHTTWTHRVEVNDELKGGLQAAFNSTYGQVPHSTRHLNQAWTKHKETVVEVAAEFDKLAGVVTSIGDTLELEAPATPNGIIASWDTRGSTPLALSRYGALRNFLLDSKRIFSNNTVPLNTHIHDTGDGQDITFWLPESSDVFDRADTAQVGAFGKALVLPVVERLISLHDELAAEYQDIRPQINFAVGLGYVEHDRYDGRTSQEYWQNAKMLKRHPSDRLNFTDHAAEAFK